MSTLYQYLAIIGWAWCIIVAIVLSVLVWRANRRERAGFEVQMSPPFAASRTGDPRSATPPAADGVASDSHAK